MTFHDPDGNGWVLQEVTTRLPGRIDAAATTFVSQADLADSMRRADLAWRQQERHPDEDGTGWPEWYARHMAGEQTGGQLPA